MAAATTIPSLASNPMPTQAIPRHPNNTRTRALALAATPALAAGILAHQRPLLPTMAGVTAAAAASSRRAGISSKEASSLKGASNHKVDTSSKVVMVVAAATSLPVDTSHPQRRAMDHTLPRRASLLPTTTTPMRRGMPHHRNRSRSSVLLDLRPCVHLPELSTMAHSSRDRAASSSRTSSTRPVSQRQREWKGQGRESSADNKGTGKRKALLIGINYFGQQGQLRGCINDVHNVQKFLMERYNYRADDMVVLTDDSKNPRQIPTRANIIQAMQWLVRDARPNDALFFH